MSSSMSKFFVYLIALLHCNYCLAINFAVLRKNDVNIRNGPGEEYTVIAKFTKAGLPVQIIHKLDNWYLIRDFEDETGWVKSNMLSFGKKNALVLEDTKICRLPVVGTEKCNVLAILKQQVIIETKYCGKKWCRVKVNYITSGWVEKNKLWGIL